MSPTTGALLQGLGAVGIALGLVGVVAPGIPGPVLIWLGALLWAVGDGFASVGWLTVIAMGVVAAVAEGLDIALTLRGARRGGVGLAGLAGAAIGAAAGFAVLSIPGAFAGALAGVVAVEARRRRDWRQGVSAARHTATGYVLGMAAQAALAILMVLMFLLAVFT